MNPIFKNTTVPEIIVGMESKFYTRKFDTCEISKHTLSIGNA